MTGTGSHIYRARLDFLYQSIAVYAVSLVMYLIVRSFVASEAFPSLWQDPIMMLLSAITLISVGALGYYLFMGRQIEITPDELRFRSRARERRIERKEISYVRFGPKFRTPHGPVRVVRIGIAGHRRPIRVRLSNFENRKKLLAELREWAGPLATSRLAVQRKEKAR